MFRYDIDRTQWSGELTLLQERPRPSQLDTDMQQEEPPDPIPHSNSRKLSAYGTWSRAGWKNIRIGCTSEDHQTRRIRRPSPPESSTKMSTENHVCDPRATKNITGLCLGVCIFCGTKLVACPYEVCLAPARRKTKSGRSRKPRELQLTTNAKDHITAIEIFVEISANAKDEKTLWLSCSHQQWPHATKPKYRKCKCVTNTSW